MGKFEIGPNNGCFLKSWTSDGSISKHWTSHTSIPPIVFQRMFFLNWRRAPKKYKSERTKWSDRSRGRRWDRGLDWGMWVIYKVFSFMRLRGYRSDRSGGRRWDRGLDWGISVIYKMFSFMLAWIPQWPTPKTQTVVPKERLKLMHLPEKRYLAFWKVEGEKVFCFYFIRRNYFLYSHL